jgi:uncharacterized protein YpmS
MAEVMNARKFPLLIGLLVLILAVLACTINIGGPAFPDQRVPVSTQAMSELQTALQTAAAAAAETGQLTITITESQITSYMAGILQAQTQPLLTDPQVYLRNGQIQVFGLAQQGYFQATVEIVFTAGVDEQGQPRIELTSADFGPLPVPAGLMDFVTAAIQEAYTGAIGPAAVGLRLENITVADGLMTIVGRTK